MEDVDLEALAGTKRKARLLQSGGWPLPHVPHNTPEGEVGKPEGLSGSQIEVSSFPKNIMEPADPRKSTCLEPIGSLPPWSEVLHAKVRSASHLLERSPPSDDPLLCRAGPCGTAVELNFEPRFRDGEGSLVEFVVSLNLHRRHLNESQRAVIGAKVKPKFEEEAKERMSEGGQKSAPGKPAEKGKANLPDLSNRQARDDAANAVNVSPRTVEFASKVLEKGALAVIQAVESGTLAVSAAAHIVDLPHEEQQQVVEMPT